MKVSLLIPATSFSSSSYGRLRKFSYPQPSIGLAYIGAVLEESGYDVQIIDAYAGKYTIEEILRRIKDSDILGISSLTTSVDATYELCKCIRADYPDIKIVYGNVHPSIFTEEVFRMGNGDFIVHREGEITFLELCDHISGSGTLSIKDILGISYMDGVKVVTNKPRPFIEDLDSLPYPAWHLYDFDNYGSDPRSEVVNGSKELQILATRGCPNVCTFCSSRSDKSQGQRYRMRSPEKVVEEIEYFHKKMDMPVFHFMDLSFPMVRSHAVDIFELMISRNMGKKIKWLSELSVKSVDKEIVSLMKRSGCVRAYFGIESGNDRVLNSIKKGFNRDDVREAVRLCHEEGIEVDGMFMLGLPGESMDTLKETVEFAVELDMRFAIFNLFVPYPGCELYDTLMNENKVRYDSWSDFISYPAYSGKKPVYVPEGLSREQLLETQKWAMKRFYLRPRFILNQIKNFRISQLDKYWSGILALMDNRLC